MSVEYPCGHDGCAPSHCQFYPDECAHGWRHDCSPGDHCDRCLEEDVERETVAKIVAALRDDGSKHVAEWIERKFSRPGEGGQKP